MDGAFRKAAAAVLMALPMASCGDECRQYSDYSCTQIENADSNVYFYFPDNTEIYLGQTSGLSSCGGIARSYANEKELSSADWGYICCMIAKGSSCYEKHR